MSIWKIISSDITDKLNRCGTYEVSEIIRAAEDLGYTKGQKTKKKRAS